MTRFNLSSNIRISFLHIFFTHEETIINNYPFSDIIEKSILTATINKYKECATSTKQVVTTTIIQGTRKTR